MPIGFDYGLGSFSARTEPFFSGIDLDLEGSFQARIQDLKDKMYYRPSSSDKPLIVILGAGPAGLIRAIQSIANGNPTIVIEKRSKDSRARENTVRLTETTIKMLKYCGIYQYLKENKLIYPMGTDGSISVRLVDLECAMKAVLKEIHPNFTIEYDAKVTEVDSESDKIKLVLDSGNGKKMSVPHIDILVNAEGSRSTTNALLGIERTVVLPSTPVIAAIYKDVRPKIRGVGSFLRYSGKSFIYLALTINYNVQFLFRFVFSSKFRRQITGTIILKTPKQNYLGCGFSDEVNNHLLSLKDVVESKKLALDKAQSAEDRQSCEKEFKVAQGKYNTFTKRWIHLSLCHANLVSIIARLHGVSMRAGSHYSLDRFEVIHIGADRANQCSQQINKTAVLLAGDAVATVDPTTGLGCNSALQSSTDFLEFLWRRERGVSEFKLYDFRMNNRIEYIHEASKQNRSRYRPDALLPQSMSMDMAQKRSV